MTRSLTFEENKSLELMQSLSPSELELVVAGIKKIKESSDKPTSSGGTSLAKVLAGRTFSQEEAIQLEMESLSRYFQHRRDLLKFALTARQVAELLGTSRQTPHDRLKSNTLLGILDNGVVKFPAWQFDPAGADGIIDGLADVLKALKISDFAKLNWLVRPHPVLDGLTPVEALKKGWKERVLQETVGVGVM
jgi:hypothetical protein